MERHEIQTGEIDKIGKRLITSNSMSEAEIDKIVAKPFLYSTVSANLVGEPARSSTGHRYRYVAAFASIAIVVSIAAAAIVSRNGASQQNALTQESVQPIPVQKFSKPDGISVDKVTTHDAVQPELRRMMPTVQNASYRKPANDNFKSRKTRTEPQPDIEFYPLAYAGDPSEATGGGRIIRVEMSRASLFAMGVNVPIENGAEMVKADLLVGADGVPRGIRMPD